MASVKHLKVLGRGASPQALGSVAKIEELVREAIQTVGMTLLGDPQIHDVTLDVRKLGREPFEDEGGISCLGCLSTSHVAIHTWPLRGEFHLDLYSCRFFDSEDFIKLVQARLDPRQLKITDCSEGCDWDDVGTGSLVYESEAREEVRPAW